MRLTILGSSSAANGYVLDNGREALAIECGCPLPDLQRAVGFDLRRVSGVLLTHEHGDHARHAKKYIQSALPLYASEGTFWHLPDEVRGSLFRHTIGYGERFKLGGFDVLPFVVRHDAAEPLGFYIKHPDMGSLLFATDTRFIPFLFDHINTWLIECNYSEEIPESNLSAGVISKAQRDRVIESHMSLDTCRETLQANDLSETRRIILIHLSDRNSDAAQFKKTIARATGREVITADRGQTIELI